MSTTLPPLAYPGLKLVPASKYASGPGTHIYESHVHASLAGVPTVDNSTKPPTVSIPRLRSSPVSAYVPSANVSTTNTLPKVGSIVLARVTRCMVRQINVAILVVDDEVCGDEWAGVVRREDVRATEKEKVMIGESFRVGDLIRGEVVRQSSNFRCRHRAMNGFFQSRCGKANRSRHHLNGKAEKLRHRLAWETKPITTSLPPGMSWESSWQRARMATPYIRSAGRSSEILSQAKQRPGRLRSRSEPIAVSSRIWSPTSTLRKRAASGALH